MTAKKGRNPYHNTPFDRAEDALQNHVFSMYRSMEKTITIDQIVLFFTFFGRFFLSFFCSFCFDLGVNFQ